MNSDSKIENITDILILGFLLVFMAVLLDIRLLFTDTIATGGDMASWYGVAHHMRDVLLPNGRLMGWDMGNFAGYPNFNFYFIPPFLIAVLPSVLFDIPLTIALKIAIASGVFVLPVSTYFGLRAMDYRFPGPIIGACASLLFLFNETYTMFGGNILSTYAGEFCYMFAFALLPWFMGSLFKGIETDTGAIKNGLLLGLIGLSHLFVFIPAVFLIVYWYFARGRLAYLIRVSLVGFGIMAFWILPLIAYRTPYTVPVYLIWNQFQSWRYHLAGLGLFLLVCTPGIVFTVLNRSPNRKAFLASGTIGTRQFERLTLFRTADGTIFLLAVFLTYIGFYLAGQYLTLGPDIWFWGTRLPGGANAPFGPACASMIKPWIVPLSVLSAAAVAGGCFWFLNDYRRFETFGKGLALLCFLVLSTLAFLGLYYFIMPALEDKALSALFKRPPFVISIGGVFILTFGALFSFSKTGRAALLEMISADDPRTLGMFLSLIFGCAVTYFAAHFLQIPDIRFLPPILFVLIIIFFVHLLGRFIAACRPASRILGAITICLLCVVAVLFGAPQSGNWFRYNNQGYEATPGYPDFKSLVDYLRTSEGEDPLNAGRVAYEKCDLYGPYGGDRVFESIPVFSGRQTLEGIHYSSSMAASFMAFFQTEFSRDIKTPNAGILSRMNLPALKAHMDLYNISQLILMTSKAKAAAADAGIFKQEADFGAISLYRYVPSDEPRYVDVPEIRPVIYKGRDWPHAFYQWFKRPESLPVLLIPDSFIRDEADRAVFRRATDTVRDLDPFKNDVLDREDVDIDAHLAHLKIQFTTNKIGVPHLIKVSYFPNWRVSGANGVYPVSPHFMMVIPRQETVVLTYSRTFWEIAGWAITGFTLLAVLTGGIFRKILPDRAVLSSHLRLLCFSGLEGRLNRLRPYLLVVLFLSCIILALSGAILRNRPVKVYTRGVQSFQKARKLAKVHQPEAATRAFEDAIRVMEAFLDDRESIDHRDVINCMLYTAMSYEGLEKWDRAEKWYRTIISEYPYSRKRGEAYVKIARIKKKGSRGRLIRGLKQIKDGNRDDGTPLAAEAVRQIVESTGYFQTAMEEDPYSIWATYARKDLAREKKFLIGLGQLLSTVYEDDELLTSMPEKIGESAAAVTVYLDATSGWLDTRLDVRAGETIRITTRGVWAAAPSIVRNVWPDTGAEGHGKHPAEQLFKHLDSQKELPGVAFGSLLGQIGNHIFAIGDRNDIVIPRSGRLLLVMNDIPDQRFDNRGIMEIRVLLQDRE